MKDQFPLLTEQCSFDEPEEVDSVQFSQQRKLSNEELIQTHEEFGLATCDPEKDCYI